MKPKNVTAVMFVTCLLAVGAWGQLRQPRALLSFRDGKLVLLANDSGIVRGQSGRVVDQFYPGQKNVLVVHGLMQAPGDQVMTAFLRFAASRYCNVVVYQYPSGEGVADNAAWLRSRLSELIWQWVSDSVTNPDHLDINFDILAYSEGGLVARAALEGSGGAPVVSNPIENLVTIGTPHLGAENYLNALWTAAEWLNFLGIPDPNQFPGVKDMLAPSVFLTALNQRCEGLPCQSSTRYFAIAGLAPDNIKGVIPDRIGDGVVSVSSAIGEGALRLAASPAVFQLFHATGLDPDTSGGRSLPCHPNVYVAVDNWLFKQSPGECVNIAGIWNVSEKAAVRCIIDGETDTEVVDGGGTVSIQQEPASCAASYSAQTLSMFNASDSLRTGVVEGGHVTFTGLFAASPADPDIVVNFTTNSFVGKGSVCGSKLSVYGSGVAEGTALDKVTGEGVSFACTGTSTGVFKRPGEEVSSAPSAQAARGLTGLVERAIVRRRARFPR